MKKMDLMKAFFVLNRQNIPESIFIVTTAQSRISGQCPISTKIDIQNSTPSQMHFFTRLGPGDIIFREVIIAK